MFGAAYAGYGEFCPGMSGFNCSAPDWQSISDTNLYKHCCGWFALDCGNCLAIQEVLINNPDLHAQGWTPIQIAAAFDMLTAQGLNPPQAHDIAQYIAGNPLFTDSALPAQPSKPIPGQCAPGDFICKIESMIGTVGQVVVVGAAVAALLYLSPYLVRGAKRIGGQIKRAKREVTQ